MAKHFALALLFALGSVCAMQPPRACCYAMTADCLSCAEGLTVDEFCARPENGLYCHATPPPMDIPEVRTMQIADHTEECYGPFPRQCMLTKTSPMQQDWEFFYDRIQGFDYQAGFEYTLEVAVYPVEFPAQDGSSEEYQLIRVVAQRAPEPKMACPLMMCFMMCEYGSVLDSNGCDTCDCLPPPPVVPRACCYAMTADCLSCAEGLTVDEFCATPSLASMAVDCPPPVLMPAVTAVRLLTSQPLHAGSARIQWVAPANHFDCETDKYLVEYRKAGKGPLRHLWSWTALPLTSDTFSGLQGLIPGASYQVRVTAVSQLGGASIPVFGRVRAGKASPRAWDGSQA